MTTIFLFRICFLSTCPNILFNDNQLRLLKAYIVARRNATAATPSRSRQRRTQNATVLAASSRAKRRRAPSVTCNPEFLQHVSQSFALSKIAPRRPPPRAHPDSRAAKGPSEVPPLVMTMPPLAHPQRPVSGMRKDAESERPSTACSESGPAPQPRPDGSVAASVSDEVVETRSVRSSSSASRNPNRLSLTLPIPINLPTSTPSRPTPSSSVTASYPATPVDTPGFMSPVDPSDFIAAIAAQERRVLDLREELARAERELNVLKRNFTHHERTKKIRENGSSQRMRDMSARARTDDPASEDSLAARRNAELERRKALLLGRQSAPGTPNQPKRRVFRGGHTRTLSLLSPTKTDPGEFSVHEDAVDQLKTSSKELDEQFANIVRYAPITPAQLSKRASWAPRTAHQHAASGVKQIAEDLRTGLWTFVEDLRQATVGDEPITGGNQPRRGFESGARSGNGHSGSFAEDQETIRASAQPTRPHVATAFEETPTPSRFGNPLQDEAGNVNRHQRKTSKSTEKPKRWSWTPLTVDSLDDSDWSSWDMPSAKSPRWSGTTVAGDAIPTIPEKIDENDASKGAQARILQTPSLSPAKLEELTWPVLNRLTPSKLKQHASDYIKEWEKSLSPPGSVILGDDDNKVKGP